MSATGPSHRRAASLQGGRDEKSRECRGAHSRCSAPGHAGEQPSDWWYVCVVGISTVLAYVSRRAICGSDAGRCWQSLGTMLGAGGAQWGAYRHTGALLARFACAVSGAVRTKNPWVLRRRKLPGDRRALRQAAWSRRKDTPGPDVFRRPSGGSPTPYASGVFHAGMLRTVPSRRAHAAY